MKSDELIGRVVFKDGQNWTVTSASSWGRHGAIFEVCVWDPVKQVLFRFDSLETFENWAYGKPVPAAAR